MCHLAEAQFAADPAAAKAARDWIVALLGQWDLDELVETAALLTSETVTNAVRHASSAPRLTAAIYDGVVEVGVADQDGSATPSARSVGDPSATGGRGLAIVDALADEWGTAYRGDGKQVWFRLQAPGWAHMDECHCHGHDPAAVELQSGRRVLVN